jgi:tetraacyldisaccharide 4'-kinase
MKALEEEEIDLFLMDDGFQHFALKRDLDIVAVDGRRRFGNGRLLPAGFLREPLSRLMEADVVVVTKSSDVDDEFNKVLGCMTNAPVCWSDYRTTDIVRLNDGSVQRTDGLTGEKFLLFSGIADPGSFEETVRDLPIELSDKARFPDHHVFSERDVRDLYEMAEKSGATALLTTEKDSIRWPQEASGIPCYSLNMDPVFLRGEQTLLERVLSLMENN